MSTSFTYNFTITGPLYVEETFTDRVRLSGDFIKLDVPTNNGRIYLSEEAEQIAGSLNGAPVYFDVTEKGKHDRRNPVGRVVATIIDRTQNVIKGIIEVWNTSKFPKLIEEVAKGWGFSIGGQVESFIPVGGLNKFFKPIVKAVGMVANHLQLLKPETPRGDPDAKVQDVKPVEESFNLEPCPFDICDLRGIDVDETEQGKDQLKALIKEAILELEQERKSEQESSVEEESQQDQDTEEPPEDVVTETEPKKKVKRIKRKKTLYSIELSPELEPAS